MMEKIISLFKRDYEGTRLVYDEIVPGAEWVSSGVGLATQKLDGTCCMVESGRLFKRYDRKRNKETLPYKPEPLGWIAAQEPDEVTGHWPGWLPVSDGPEDKWHREAFESYGNTLQNGTYELLGPKIQGNPEGALKHRLDAHGAKLFSVDPPTSFVGLREWFKGMDIEGIVWHHPDGRMVKIKKKDFGMKRGKK